MTLEFTTIDKKKFKLVVSSYPGQSKDEQAQTLLAGFKTQGYLKLDDNRYLMYPTVSTVEVID